MQNNRNTPSPRPTRRPSLPSVEYSPWPFDDRRHTIRLLPHGCGSLSYHLRVLDGGPLCNRCYPYYWKPIPKIPLQGTTKAERDQMKTNAERLLAGTKHLKEKKGRK